MDILELAEKLKVKKDKEEAVKVKYVDLNKAKKLTTEQRLVRLEELHNIE